VKRFGSLTAVNDVDLDIEPGELFGLLGPNGAGKTTLISILATMTDPSSGSATVCGYDVTKEQSSVRSSIGIVFQDPSLDEELTGHENLDFHGRLYGMDANRRRERIEDVLRLVELEDRRNDLVKTYSGGMRRRLEIARGLMHQPEVLFLDEPTLGLDPQTRRRIWNYIKDLNSSVGMTMILTTHYMDEAEQLCSRVGIIDQGVIVALDSPGGLRSSLGGDLLEFTARPADSGFLETLSKTDGVEEIETDGTTIRLTVTNGDSALPRIFQQAMDSGIDVTSLSLRRPNLEDVFIKLTGREIREETVADAKDRIRVYLKPRRR
jgi:ABC-2 type transport system ATP-binding protein